MAKDWLDNLLDTISEEAKNIFVGKPPIINRSLYIIGTNITDSIKEAITENIDAILAKNPNKHYKFGKTGHSAKRAKDDKYRANYNQMYLLFSSEKEISVEKLEIHFATLHHKNELCDNKDLNSVGEMKAIRGKYFLYLVI